MDGLDQLLPSIISGGSFGAGTLANILQGQKQGNYQNLLLDLISHPEKLAAMIAKIQQPLNNGLTQAVGNRVQGDLAQRGLSQAPGIFATSESQALAPYYQENQNAAQSALFSALGLPAGSFGKPVDTTGSLQLFLNALRNRAGGGGNGGATGFQFPISGDTTPDWGSGFPDSSSGSSGVGVY